MHPIYSLGHSSRTWDRFASLLDTYRIGCVVDVRSRPRSRWTAYSYPNFRIKLNDVGVSYVFMGKALGGQPATGPSDYAGIAAGSEFQSGISTLGEIARRCVVAIVCSEHDPIQCHRFLLISRALAARGVDVQHILRDGQIEAHAAALRRLQRSLPHLPLFPGDVDSDLAFEAQENRLRRADG